MNPMESIAHQPASWAGASPGTSFLKKKKLRASATYQRYHGNKLLPDQFDHGSYCETHTANAIRLYSVVCLLPLLRYAFNEWRCHSSFFQTTSLSSIPVHTNDFPLNWATTAYLHIGSSLAVKNQVFQISRDDFLELAFIFSTQQYSSIVCFLYSHIESTAVLAKIIALFIKSIQFFVQERIISAKVNMQWHCICELLRPS
jgi:hypothetical protein